MSKFHSFARRLDDAAKKIFTEYQEAEADFKTAQIAKDRGPRRGNWQDAQTVAKIARLESDFQAARVALDAARRELPERGERELRAIRAELADAVSAAFIVSPTQVDSATVELMKSGICTAADYEKLLADADRANNSTMIRLIASYAGKAAEAMRDENGRLPFDSWEEWSRLDNVGKQGQAHTTAAVLEAYDTLTEIFRRSLRNPGMIGHWAELTENAIAEF